MCHTFAQLMSPKSVLCYTFKPLGTARGSDINNDKHQVLYSNLFLSFR